MPSGSSWLSRTAPLWFLILLTRPPATMGQDDSTRGSEPVVSLTFDGGTAVEYVAAVRRSAGDVNVIFDRGLASVEIGAVQLKRVSVGAALEVLDALRRTVDGAPVQTRMRMVDRGGEGGALPVYRLAAEPTGPRPPKDPDRIWNVWSLLPMIEAGTKPEDALTAIEAALGLFGPDRRPANLRFHRETGLLLAEGDTAQVEIIDAIVQRLSDRRPPHDDLDQLRREKDLEISTLRARLDKLQEADRAAVRSETRASLLGEEVERLNAALTDLRARLEHEVAERDARIRALLTERGSRNDER